MKVEIKKIRLKSGLFHYAYRVRLLRSYRNEDGNPRNEFVWAATYNPHRKDNYNYFDECTPEHWKSRFWDSVDRELSQHEIPQADKERILGQVETVIPRLTEAEIRKLDAEREAKREKKRSRETSEAKSQLLRRAMQDLKSGELTKEQYNKLIASYR